MRKLRGSIGLAALCAAGNGVARAAVVYDRVMLSGDAAPGTPAGTTFSSAVVVPPALNAQGQVIFHAVLAAGPGVTSSNNGGTWFGAPGALQLVARRGDPADGMPEGVNFNGMSSVAINDAGHVAAIGSVAGTGVTSGNNTALWSGAPGAMQVLARTGSQAPGEVSGVTFTNLSNPPLFNDAGQVALVASTTAGGGIWIGAPGALQRVVRSGDQLPGTPDGAAFVGTSSMVLNGSGTVAFRGDLSGNNRDGIWTASATGEVQYVARNGDPAPGTAPGVTFNWNPSLTGPQINDAGQVAFAAAIAGPGVTTSNNTGIWVGTPGAMQLTVRTGDAAPDAPAGATFSGLDRPVLNGSGDVAFVASLSGGDVTSANDTAVYVGGGGAAGALRLAAREGAPAPTADGADVHFLTFDSRLSRNNQDQVLFAATLGGAGVTADNDRGLWLDDPSAGLVSIIREGDAIDVDPGAAVDLRSVLSFAMPASGGSPENGHPTILNDAGEVALRLGFTDGTSGIFVAQVPEPATLALIVPAAATLLSRRRRRP